VSHITFLYNELLPGKTMEVFMAVAMKSIIFGDVTLFSLAEVNRN
jgi:hypothetical protein